MIRYINNKSALRGLCVLMLISLVGCGTTSHAPLEQQRPDQAAAVSRSAITEATFENEPESSADGKEVAFYALTLLRIGYLFGGKNPAAGVDCSGLVTVSYREALGRNLVGNAAALARQGREVPLNRLRSGDLLFFNTLGRPFSHVAIYIGRGKFVHAPNSRGRVRVEKLTTKYWAQRFETARTIID